MEIKKTDDFDVTGDGSGENWNQTDWISLTQRSNQENTDGLATRVKILYSDTGMYFLFHSEMMFLTPPSIPTFKNSGTRML